MKKLIIISTHPIQYYAPFFKILAKEKELDVKVFYTWGTDVLENKYDPDFGKQIQWDIPLLEGYNYHFTKNIAKNPGSSHFNGIITPDLINEIETFKPNVILIYGYAYRGHLKLIRHFKNKIPIWLRGDSTLLDEKAGLKSLLKKIYLKWIYNHIDKALYVGEENKKYFKKYGLKDHQLLFVPHAIDNDRFSEDRETEALQLRENLGIKENDILILFAGKLEDKKNPELLLNSFNELDKENIHLLFVGNGILERKLKADASTSLSMTRIHFLDFQNQAYMPVVYQACDLFCLPSKGPGETWGLAVNEAMAAGKAILVADKVGCSTDLVKENVNGSIFKSGDTDDFLIKLKGLSNKQQLKEMGKQSKLLIKDWSFKKQKENILDKLS